MGFRAARSVSELLLGEGEGGGGGKLGVTMRWRVSWSFRVFVASILKECIY